MSGQELDADGIHRSLSRQDQLVYLRVRTLLVKFFFPTLSSDICQHTWLKISCVPSLSQDCHLSHLCLHFLLLRDCDILDLDNVPLFIEKQWIKVGKQYRKDDTP